MTHTCTSASGLSDTCAVWLLLVYGSCVCSLRICVSCSSGLSRPYVLLRVPIDSTHHCMTGTDRCDRLHPHADVQLAMC